MHHTDRNMKKELGNSNMQSDMLEKIFQIVSDYISSIRNNAQGGTKASKYVSNLVQCHSFSWTLWDIQLCFKNILRNFPRKAYQTVKGSKQLLLEDKNYIQEKTGIRLSLPITNVFFLYMSGNPIGPSYILRNVFIAFLPK